MTIVIEKADKYVIYCRKSTDEQGKQETSIEDQRVYCEELAAKEGLNVVRVIEEKKSAKVSGLRPLFNEMMDSIRTGKIDGVITWHPDRLARNMGEGGQIIELVDSKQIKDLKFCTQQFSRDSGGKMLLGLAFVLSKEYSDKMSEVITRGNERRHEKGLARGNTKHGYEIDEDGQYQKGKFFDLIKAAFQQKLKGVPETEICKWLNRNGYYRKIKKTESKRPIQTMYPQKLTKIFKDSFYMGKNTMKGQQIYLPDKYDFTPMITEDEYIQIQRMGKRTVSKKKEHYLRGKITDEKYPYLEYKPQIIKNRIKTPYLYYVVDNRHKIRIPAEDREFLIAVRAKKIVDALDSLFKNINPQFTEDNFRKSIKLAREYSDESINAIDEENQRLKGMITKAQNELNNLEENYLLNGKNYDSSEKTRYFNKKEELTKEIGGYIQKMKNNTADMKDLIPSFENFLNTIKILSTSYKSMDGNTKLEIAEIMVLNIVVSKGEVLEIELNEMFDELFIHSGGR